jgi:hypothetical protein
LYLAATALSVRCPGVDLYGLCILINTILGIGDVKGLDGQRDSDYLCGVATDRAGCRLAAVAVREIEG